MYDNTLWYILKHQKTRKQWQKNPATQCTQQMLSANYVCTVPSCLK